MSMIYYIDGDKVDHQYLYRAFSPLPRKMTIAATPTAHCFSDTGTQLQRLAAAAPASHFCRATHCRAEMQECCELENRLVRLRI